MRLRSSRKKPTPAPAPEATNPEPQNQGNGSSNAADPWAMNEKIIGVQEWLEKTSLIPIFVATILAMMFRGLFTYALGAVAPTDIPAAILKTINFAVGLAVAGLVETLATMSGRKWWVGMDTLLMLPEKYSAQLAQPKIKKPLKDEHGKLKRDAEGYVLYETVDNPRYLRAKELLKNKQDRQRFLNAANLGFMIVGTVTSFLAAMRYIWVVNGIGDGDWTSHAGDIFVDGLVTLLILAGIFYIGVIYEPAKADADELTKTARKRLRFMTMNEKYDRIRTGIQTNADIRYLIRGAAPEERAELESMMKVDRTRELWTVAQIMNWLGWPNERRRDVTRRIKAAFDKGVEGVMHDPDDPRKWIVQVPVVVELFQKEFIASRIVVEASATAGQSSAPRLGGANRQDPATGGSSADHRQEDGHTGTADSSTVIDSTIETPGEAPASEEETETRDIEDHAAQLAGQIELAERAIRLEFERDLNQDLDALSQRFGLPIAHIAVIGKEVANMRIMAELERDPFQDLGPLAERYGAPLQYVHELWQKVIQSHALRGPGEMAS